jgi:hypothetical protein
MIGVNGSSSGETPPRWCPLRSGDTGPIIGGLPLVSLKPSMNGLIDGRTIDFKGTFTKTSAGACLFGSVKG